MNCALGPKELRPLIEELSGIAPIYVSLSERRSAESAVADRLS